MDPPRPALNFKEIIEYSSLAEFDILRDTRGTVQSRIWAQPSYRAAMAYYFKMKCARKEIKRLNIEITRLRSFIRDDTALHSYTITALRSTNPGLATVLSHQWELRARVNLVHLARLNALACIPGYTGTTACGMRIGQSYLDAELPGVEDSLREMDIDGEAAVDLSDDEGLQDALNAVSDFISNVQ